MSIGSSFCECGQEKDRDLPMCNDCQKLSSKRDHAFSVGKKPKKLSLKLTGKCMKCGNKCSYAASYCKKCYNDYDI